MNDISRVAASKVRHGNADLLIVVLQVDANVLFQLLAATQRCVGRVFVEDTAVDQVLSGVLRARTHARCQPGNQSLMQTNWMLNHSYVRDEVVAVHVNGGQDQAGHEHNQAKGQTAQAVERRLPGPQGQNQLLLILGKDTQTLTHEHFKQAERDGFSAAAA